MRICFFNHFSPVPSSVELFFRAVRRIIRLPPLELSAAAVAASTTNVDESPPISAVGPFYFRNRIYKIFDVSFGCLFHDHTRPSVSNKILYHVSSCLPSAIYGPNILRIFPVEFVSSFSHHLSSALRRLFFWKKFDSSSYLYVCAVWLWCSLTCFFIV